MHRTGIVVSTGINVHDAVGGKKIDALKYGDRFHILKTIAAGAHGNKLEWLKISFERRHGDNVIGFVAPKDAHGNVLAEIDAPVADVPPPSPADDQIAAPDAPMFPLKGWLIGLVILVALAAIYWIGGR